MKIIESLFAVILIVSFITFVPLSALLPFIYLFASKSTVCTIVDILVSFQSVFYLGLMFILLKRN